MRTNLACAWPVHKIWLLGPGILINMYLFVNVPLWIREKTCVMAVSGVVYTYKNHTKISCEYSAIKCWLRCRDILRIQKISDARTIKNRWLMTKTSPICAGKDKHH